MITIAAVLARIPALDEARLRAWVDEDWVRPTRSGGDLLFAEIDMARLVLILELEEFEVGSGAMPIVLSLLDRLYQQRRQMRRVATALQTAGVDPATLLLDEPEH